MSDERLNKILARGSLHQVRKIINEDILAVDVARILEASPPKERRLLWGLLDEERTGQVLQDLDEEVRADFLDQLQVDEIADSFEQLSDDDITDILHQLPERVTKEVLQRMEEDDRERVERLLDYPEGTVGALMTTQILTVRANISLEVVMRYLRMGPKIKTTVGKLVVVDSSGHYLGILALASLVQNALTKQVGEIMDADTVTLKVTDDNKKVIDVFERYDMVSVPVVGERNEFLGMVTVDDVIDIVRNERDHTLLRAAGLGSEEDTFAPWSRIAEKRILWLGINLMTVLIASFFIGMFRDILEEVIALAILMPIVASMGGIAGLQSMTIVVRAQALGRLNIPNVRWLLARETTLGFVNGILWAVVVSLLALFWFNDIYVAFALGLALIFNLLVGSFLGVVLPVALEKNNVDPANAGGVLLTTVTDVLGFVFFLGLASLLYF